MECWWYEGCGVPLWTLIEIPKAVSGPSNQAQLEISRKIFKQILQTVPLKTYYYILSTYFECSLKSSFGQICNSLIPWLMNLKEFKCQASEIVSWLTGQLTEVSQFAAHLGKYARAYNAMLSRVHSLAHFVHTLCTLCAHCVQTWCTVCNCIHYIANSVHSMWHCAM